MEGVRKNPYGCEHCGTLLVKTVFPADAREQIEHVERGISMWRRDLRMDAEAHMRRSPVKEVLPPDGHEPRETARRRRHLSRHTARPTQCTNRWNWFPQELQCIDSPNAPPATISGPVDLRAMASPPTRSLQWLRDLCSPFRSDSLELLGKSWLRIQYITPLASDAQISTVAAALHLTMTKYGCHPINLRSLECDPQNEVPYRNVTWNGTHSSAIPRTYKEVSGSLVSMEILAYFALCLRRCAGFDRSSHRLETAGHEESAECCYVPAWQVRKEGRGWLMCARPRASQKLVTWLLRRCHDTPLRRLVVCMAPDRSRFGFHDPALPWTGDVPDELLRFPRCPPPSTTGGG